MRLWGIALIVVVCVGCSSSGSSAAPHFDKATDLVAALKAKHVDCRDYASVDESNPAVKSGGGCTINGHHIKILLYGSTKTTEAQMRLGKSIVCKQHLGSFPYVRGDTWVVSASSSETISKVAKALRVPARRLTC